MSEITILNGDSLEVLKTIDDETIDMCITSPPYFNLRDYGVRGQIGSESTIEQYLNNLYLIFDEVKRVLKKDGSCWVNIDDVYNDKCLMCIPDMFKIGMIMRGWLCRNEIIWRKPNAMPSSAKSRYNNDYEKMFFFTKSKEYYFETQYEPFKTKKPKASKTHTDGKYISLEQEASVRQGMNRARGTKIIEVRKELPTQERFVSFLRSRTNANYIAENTDIPRTKIEHWFRKDKGGFSYPSVEDWNNTKYLLDDWSEEFKSIDYGLTEVSYETDDILKNADKGRIKRSVWDINTKGYKGYHYAPFPTELVKSPIKACCPNNGIVLDCFMGSGTVGVVAKEQGKNFIGIELNNAYCELAKQRIG